MTREPTDNELEIFRARLNETPTVLLAEVGLEETSLRSLAARLEISRPTPWRRLRDLDAILQTVGSAIPDADPLRQRGRSR